MNVQLIGHTNLGRFNYSLYFKRSHLSLSLVPALLEHEAIAGLTASKPTGLRGRASSNARDLEESQHSLDELMRTVSELLLLYIKLLIKETL